MKWLHYINFLLIFLFIVAICVLEEYMVSSSLELVQTSCYEIEKYVSEEGGLQNMEVALALENLEYNWTKNEASLCFLVNHKSISEIGQEIAKMKYCLSNDDVELFMTGVDLIKLYCKSYMHFMGANLHNLL